MPLIDATGTSVDRISPDNVKKSIAPERTCDSMSVSEPSWLFGNTWMSTRPPESFKIACAALWARTFNGCTAGRLLANFSLNSPAWARADGPSTLAPSVPALTAHAWVRNSRRAGRFMVGILMLHVAVLAAGPRL